MPLIETSASPLDVFDDVCEDSKDFHRDNSLLRLKEEWEEEEEEEEEETLFGFILES